MEELGGQPGTLGVTFRKAQNHIQEPTLLTQLLRELINSENCLSLDSGVKDDAYESLLERSASPENRERARAWLNRLDGIVDTTFFDTLQDEFEADAADRTSILHRWLLTDGDGDGVINHARVAPRRRGFAALPSDIPLQGPRGRRRAVRGPAARKQRIPAPFQGRQ